MKFRFGIHLLCWTVFYCTAAAQDPAGREIAVNEEQLSYLEPETCEFAEKYNFDMRFNTFKEVTYKTYLFRSPSLDMKELIKPVPRGAIVKAYKYQKASNTWAVKFQNDWGFIQDDYLKRIEKYEEPLKQDDLDTPPQLLSKLSFRYPSRLKKDGVAGEVVLRILVSNTGEVSHIEVEKSVPQLDSIAIKAVEDLRFKPAKKYGVPTDVWVRVPLNFE
jgi:TonB family protein